VSPRKSPAAAVTVVVLVMQSTERLRRCLEHLGRSAGVAHDVVVVANGTPPEELEGVEHEGVRVLRFDRNLGFAGGCNAGAAAAAGRDLVFLNDDTEPEPGWLAALVAAADRDQSIGAVGSCLLNADGTIQETAGVVWGDGATHLIREATDELADVDYASGAALLVRRRTWDRVGGFDEFFSPGYYEDVDLCWSIRSAGFRLVAAPEARVLHHGSGSTRKAERDFISERNRRRFLFKWAAELRAREERPADRIAAAREWGPRYAKRTLDGPRWSLPRLDGNPESRAHRTELELEARDAYLEHLEREAARVRPVLERRGRTARAVRRAVAAVPGARALHRALTGQ
jgi:GT2 family glycosyltransferase